jgi:hypothetical protein
MTKAKTKAARRRKPRISLPGGGSVPQAATHSRDRRHTHQPQEDARTTVMAARAARIPKDADPLSRMAGCAVGQRLMRENDADRRLRLWGAVCHMRQVYAAYDRALGGPSRYPKCLAILAPTDTMEAADHHIPVDLRTEEERYRAAIRDWARVQGWLQQVDRQAHGACVAVVIDDVLVQDWRGVMLALDKVADGMTGTKA